ncbi:MAG: hypothetical protein QOG14_3593, partial [Mycobacterium sp.]|nr:hypothetical protein [Mycobacterium sp.]
MWLLVRLSARDHIKRERGIPDRVSPKTGRSANFPTRRRRVVL